MESPAVTQSGLTPRAVGKHEEPRAQALLGATPGNFATPAAPPVIGAHVGGRVGSGSRSRSRGRGARSHSPWKATALALPETS